MNNPLFNNNMAPPYGKSDISNQLIRDSYQYVLQADTVTGVMYRINGDFLTNPIFTSGLTIYSGFTYSDGNEQSGYVLTYDITTGFAKWAPVSAATPSSGVTSITAISPLSASPSTGNVTISLTESYVPIAGGTMSGRLYNEQGITVTGDVTSDYIITKDITATTISATTLHIENTADISAGSITAETYSGATIIVNNFTAVTVSATTYLNLPESADTKVTGFSLTDNVITLSQNRDDQYSAFTISLSAYTGNTSSSGDYLPLSGGTVSGNTTFTSGLTASTLNVTGNTTLNGLSAGTISATTYYGVNAATGGTYSNGTITLSGTGTLGTITGLTSLTPTTLYSGNGSLISNRIVNLSSYTLNFSSSTNPDTLVLSGGSVGIGKQPSSRLDVDGDINIPVTTGSTFGVIKQSGSTILHSYGTNNFFLGNKVGNFTLTGQRNFAMGLESLQFLTTGTNNVAMGIKALPALNNGASNVGIGYFSQAFNVGGNSNVSIGSNTLFSNTSGNQNVAVGDAALINNLGDGNVAIGYNAGYFETGSNKLYIANQSSNVRQALIYGEFDNQKVGINTQTPTNALSVYSTSDPLQLSNVQTSTDSDILTIDGAGVVHKQTKPFLRNETHSGTTDTIQINESIFNPSNLTVLSGSTFIVDYNADYYVLGDLYNSGTTIINGTLKVGGVIYNVGTITGPGILE